MNQMVPNGSGDKAIELFAKACERLNEFSRNLRSSSLYTNALPYSNIQNYLHSGWSLQKYVEAVVQESPEDTASWYLGLGKPGLWLINASVSLAHSGMSIEVLDCFAETDEQLELALKKAVDALIAEAEIGSNLHQLIVKKKTLGSD
jgi:hypothetical protein